MATVSMFVTLFTDTFSKVLAPKASKATHYTLVECVDLAFTSKGTDGSLPKNAWSLSYFGRTTNNARHKTIRVLVGGEVETRTFITI